MRNVEERRVFDVKQFQSLKLVLVTKTSLRKVPNENLFISKIEPVALILEPVLK